MSIDESSVDDTKLEALSETAMNDIGAIAYGPLAMIGFRLGLYDALADHGPLSPADLADRTGTAERYVREWLAASAASNYVTYDPETERFNLSPEQATVLTGRDGDAPTHARLLKLAVAMVKDLPDIERAFRSGEGVGWEEHNEALEEILGEPRPPEVAENIVNEWIPALDGVEETLENGARVVDIGCGDGAKTIMMARAYPQSTFVGVDLNEKSISTARDRANEGGVADRVSFEVTAASEFDGTGFDLATTFNCLHDMGDPVGVASNIHGMLGEAGTWMINDHLSGDRLTENLNQRGRVLYSASTMLCVPGAVAQDGSYALGAQPGPERLREVVIEGGFSQVRKVAEAPPFDMVLEAIP